MNKEKIKICLLGLSFFLSSCQRDEQYLTVGYQNGPKLSNIIKYTSLQDSAIADGVTPVLIKIQVSPETDSSNRKLKIKTSLGTFSNSDTILDISVSAAGEVSVPITSNINGIAFIRASIGTFSADTLIVFAKAFPSDMIFAADKYVIDTSQTISLTCNLVRDKGRVTDPTMVYFSATADSLSQAPLILPPFANSTNNSVAVNVKNPFGSMGWFTISSYALRGNGDTLKRSIRVKIN